MKGTKKASVLYNAIKPLDEMLDDSRGEMAEWSKAHAWSACMRQPRIVGSNPTLSAIGGRFNLVM